MLSERRSSSFGVLCEAPLLRTRLNRARPRKKKWILNRKLQQKFAIKRSRHSYRKRRSNVDLVKRFYDYRRKNGSRDPEFFKYKEFHTFSHTESFSPEDSAYIVGNTRWACSFLHNMHKVTHRVKYILDRDIHTTAINTDVIKSCVITFKTFLANKPDDISSIWYKNVWAILASRVLSAMGDLRRRCRMLKTLADSDKSLVKFLVCFNGDWFMRIRTSLFH
jgi:hypothetical protein